MKKVCVVGDGAITAFVCWGLLQQGVFVYCINNFRNSNLDSFTRLIDHDYFVLVNQEVEPSNEVKAWFVEE